MDKERRTFTATLSIEQRGEDDPPVIQGHAALFNSLSEPLFGFREKIAPGAFKNAIKEDDIRALFNHNPDHVLGRNKSGTLRLNEDKKGLAIEIDPPDTQVARDLQTSIKRGDITQMSFGFQVVKDTFDHKDDGDVIRTLEEVRLFDVSPVTYPAYTDTDVSVRSFEDWKSEQEEIAHRSIDTMRKRVDLAELI